MPPKMMTNTLFKKAIFCGIIAGLLINIDNWYLSSVISFIQNTQTKYFILKGISFTVLIVLSIVVFKKVEFIRFSKILSLAIAFATIASTTSIIMNKFLFFSMNINYPYKRVFENIIYNTIPAFVIALIIGFIISANNHFKSGQSVTNLFKK